MASAHDEWTEEILAWLAFEDGVDHRQDPEPGIRELMEGVREDFARLTA